MKEEYKELPLIKNEETSQFEMNVEGLKAFIDYKQSGDRLFLLHTEVEPALEGKGTATALIEKTLNYTEQNNFKLVPICPLIVAYIKRHPEWKKIVDPAVDTFNE